MARGEFIVKIIRGEIVKENFNSDTKADLEVYYRFIDQYHEKANEISEIIKKEGIISKEALKVELEKRLLEADFYYSKNRNGNFRYRVPNGFISAQKINEISVGEEEEFFSHTIFVYKINIIAYY